MGYPRSYQAVYQPSCGPTQADTQPDTHVDNPRRIPFSVGFVYKCNYQSDCYELIYNNLTLIATEIYIPYDMGAISYFHKPTELCDGNYHRNKTIQSCSNGITFLYLK